MHTIILEEFASYTVVMVSHRLEGVMDFDTVIVMDDGSVAEKGLPKQLVQSETSRLRALWNADTRS